MTEKDDPKPLLSCDSVNDAIRSLALFYDLDFKNVNKVFHSSWPDFLSKDIAYDEFHDDRLACCLGQYLNSKSIRKDIGACFYHRARFDGNQNWFEDGLLNNREGAVAFFQKLKRIDGWPSRCDVAESFALRNIHARDSMSGMFGPHAFDLLEHAKLAGTNGLNYDRPEFLMGDVWNNHDVLRDDIDNFICQKLQPVIVKFRAKPEATDRYINHLWMYLHASRFNLEYVDPSIYSFCGKGISVPGADILELIKIN